MKPIENKSEPVDDVDNLDSVDSKSNSDPEEELADDLNEFEKEEIRTTRILEKLAKKDLTEVLPTDEDIGTLFEYIYNNVGLDYAYTKTKINSESDNQKEQEQEQETRYYNGERDKYDDPEPYNGHIYYKIDYSGTGIFNRDLKKIMFPEKYTVVLYNMSGCNDDVRGSDLTNIELDFCGSFVLSDNTYESLCEGLFRIKSHKFDNWYELYNGCNIKIDENTNTINITLGFDHGS